MLKGLNRKVIEIVEPNSELIERVIVILKPGIPPVSFRGEQEQIERCISGISCKKRTGWRWGLAAAGAALVIGLLILLL